MKSRRVGRQDVTGALSTALERLRFVRAFWEGGSAAFDRVDKWSDLDLYILVDEEKTAKTFDVVERTLSALSPITLTYAVESGYEGVSQKFYRLRDAGEFAVVDLAIVTPKSPEMFLTPEIHGNNVFYFNKRKAARAKPFDGPSFDKRREERLNRLALRFEMFNNYVAKELEREHPLEALEDYRGITLATLVEALRMRYSPLHYDFRAHYVDRELPAEVRRRLIRLSYVKDPEDLKARYREATKWCMEALSHASRAV